MDFISSFEDTLFTFAGLKSVTFHATPASQCEYAPAAPHGERAGTEPMADLPSAVRLLGEAVKMLSEALALLAASGLPLDTESDRRRFPDSPPADEWLTPQEASRRLQMPLRALHRRWRKLDFCRPLPGGVRGYRVSAAGLEAAMKRRR